MQECKFGCGQMDADVNGWMHNEGHGFGCIQVNVDGWIQIWMGGWMVEYMGQKLQDGKKSAQNVPTSPSLGELPRPNHESDQLLFLNSWKITPIFTFLGPFLKANINGGHCFRFFEVSEELIQALVRITVESDYSKLQWTHLSLTKIIVFAGFYSYCIYHDY